MKAPETTETASSTFAKNALAKQVEVEVTNNTSRTIAVPSDEGFQMLAAGESGSFKMSRAQARKLNSIDGIEVTGDVEDDEAKTKTSARRSKAAQPVAPGAGTDIKSQAAGEGTGTESDAPTTDGTTVKTRSGSKPATKSED